jgi:hypothetical protein
MSIVAAAKEERVTSEEGKQGTRSRKQRGEAAAFYPRPFANSRRQERVMGNGRPKSDY